MDSDISAWPHVTGGPDRPGILYDLGLLQGNGRYLPRHRRRGRLVDACASLLAMGEPIPDDWWPQHSGVMRIDPRTGAHNDYDYVEHEECREYVEGVRKVLAVTGIHVNGRQVPVINRNLRYQGRADLIGSIGNELWCWDWKCGQPELWHPLQGAGYVAALSGSQRYRFANVYLPSGKIIDRTDPPHLLAWLGHLQAFGDFARCWWRRREYLETKEKDQWKT